MEESREMQVMVDDDTKPEGQQTVQQPPPYVIGYAQPALATTMQQASNSVSFYKSVMMLLSQTIL